MVRPVLSRARTRWAACCNKFAWIASQGAGRAPNGRNVAGTVLMLPSIASVVGQQLEQQISESIGVGKTFRKAPIGLINLLLYTRTVKRPVGKTVDGEDIKSMIGKERLEGRKLARLRGERLGRDIGQAKSNAHGHRRRHLALDLRQVAPQPGRVSTQVSPR